MADKTYNGWTNYETWNVKLWLDNEQGTYYEVTGHATEVYAEAAEDGQDATDYPYSTNMATWLKEYVEEMQPELPASTFSDLLNAALSEVDWLEIAKSYLDDAKEEAERS